MLISLKNFQEIYKQNGAVGKLIHSNDNLEFVKLEIEPNGIVPEHILEMDVSFYVIKGKGKAVINKKIIEANEGDFISVSKNEKRGWTNNSFSNLELLVIKEK